MQFRLWMSRKPLKYFYEVCDFLRTKTTERQMSYIGSERRCRNRARLGVEQLEDRCLLSTWSPIGPSPQYSPTDGQNYAGLVSSLAFSSNYDGKGDPALFQGTAGGGIWRSTGPRNFLDISSFADFA